MLPDCGMPVPEALLHRDLWVADAVYTPLWTPLLTAINNRNYALASMLLDRGADPNAQLFFKPANLRGATNHKGTTPLIRAANACVLFFISLGRLAFPLRLSSDESAWAIRPSRRRSHCEKDPRPAGTPCATTSNTPPEDGIVDMNVAK